MASVEYDNSHAIIIDNVFVSVRSLLSRMESYTGLRLSVYTPQVTFYLKRLKKNYGKYSYSVSSTVAVLYFMKIISRKEAFELLEVYGGSKKRFKEVFSLLLKLKEEEERKKRKITCPRCGLPGYLTKRGEYVYVTHYVNGVVKTCYLGKEEKDISILKG